MTQSKYQSRINRKKRIRKKVFGTSVCPRLTIFRSLKHLYAQIIDDMEGKTLIASSTLEEGLVGKRNKQSAQSLGKNIGEKAKNNKIETVVFDRNGYLYHGCVKAFADAVREAGVRF
jgi:large subunit ribosomal protein L18